jgi:hypothetical protein
MTRPEDPEPDQENFREHPQTMIGVRTATLLYLLLCIAAFATMKGKALALSLIIIFGTAARSYLHYWRTIRRD